MRPIFVRYSEKKNTRGKNEGYLFIKIMAISGFPGGAVVEGLPADAGNTGSSPGLGRSHMPRSS